MCFSHNVLVGTTDDNSPHRHRFGGLRLPSENIFRGCKRRLRNHCVLAALPRELLSNIAARLPSDADLINLRLASDRAIRDGIDFVFVRRFFEVQKFVLEQSSLLKIANIAHSRLASEVRVLEVELRYEYPDFSKTPYQSVTITSKSPCIQADNCTSHFYSTFLSLFENMNGLSASVIRAPTRTTVSIRDVQYALQQEADMDWNLGRVSTCLTPLAHRHVDNIHTPRSVFHAMFAAVERSRVVLERLDFVGFTICPWTGEFAPTTPVLATIATTPCFQALRSIIFDLDVYHMESNTATANIVRILERNPNLKNLDLFLRPTCQSHREQQESGSREIIKCLARSSFRLQTLKLVGLRANGSIILDQVFQNHAKTLRCLTLESTHLRLPNKNRTFWNTLLKLDLEYFATRYFWYNSSGMLCSGHLNQCLRGDALDWLSLDKDQSYMDYVMVSWTAHTDDWIIWDYVDHDNGKELLKERFEDVIVMINCGAIKAE